MLWVSDLLHDNLVGQVTNGNNKSDARVFAQSKAIYSHAYKDKCHLPSFGRGKVTLFFFIYIWPWTGKEGREGEGVFVIHPQALLNFASEE